MSEKVVISTLQFEEEMEIYSLMRLLNKADNILLSIITHELVNHFVCLEENFPLAFE